MKRDDSQELRSRRPLESISAEIPESLLDADELLTRYGRWAVTTGRGGGAYTLERMYVPEKERTARYALDNRREADYGKATKQPLLSTPDALTVQRALARVPDRERIVLAVLYVPRKDPPAKQLAILRIPPKLAQIRHLAGLRMFWNLHGVVAAQRGA